MTHMPQPGWKRRVWVVAAALVCNAWVAPQLAAQTHLHVLTKSIDVTCAPTIPCEPGRVQTVDVERGVLIGDQPARATWGLVSPPDVSADGRFVVWVGSHFPEPAALPDLAFVDLVTGYSGRALRVNNSQVFMDPRQTRAYLNTSQRDLQIVEPGRSVTLPVDCGPLVDGGWDLTTMSRDRRRAFMRCPIRPYSGVTYVVDVATGARLATIEDAATWQAANDDGTELFTLDRGTMGRGRVRRIGVATQSIVVEREVGTLDSNLIDIAFDSRNNRVLVFGNNELFALDAATLAETGRIVGPIPNSHMTVALDPDIPHLYVTWSRHEVASGAFRTIAQQRDSATLALLAEGQLPSTGMPAGVIVGPRVMAPTAPAAVVTERTVRISWTPSQDAGLRTGFVVEAGSAPGLADTAVFGLSATDTQLVVTDVPAGTYYVRVRAVNGTGPGIASAEVVVRVP